MRERSGGCRIARSTETSRRLQQLSRQTLSHAIARTDSITLVRSTLSTTLLLAAGTANAAIRNVPAAFPTIQDAINAALPGDTVLVAPGTYHERIDFLGKTIVVKASAFNDPTLTIIDADLLGTAVRIGGGVGPDAKLIGFTIREGDATAGGGLDLTGDATIRDCRFLDLDAESIENYATMLLTNSTILGGDVAVECNS